MSKDKGDIRKAILGAVRQVRRHQPGWRAYPVTVTLDVPAALTASAPVWAPPGCREISTAQAWARADVPGLFHAVVTTYSREEEGALVLASGLITVEDLLGLGSVCDKAHRIRWMAVEGTLAEEPLDGAHPAAAYQAWVEHAEQEAQDVLFPGTGHSTAYHPVEDDVSFEHCPDGSWRVIVPVELDAWPRVQAGDVDLAADRIAALARHYGRRTRVRVYPGSRHHAGYRITEPVYAAAMAAFWPAPGAGQPERAERDKHASYAGALQALITRAGEGLAST